MEVIFVFVGLMAFFGSIVIHLTLALAIYRDADQIERSGFSTVFVGRFLWTFMTLIGGLLVVTVYWLMHHSTLRRDP